MSYFQIQLKKNGILVNTCNVYNTILIFTDFLFQNYTIVHANYDSYLFKIVTWDVETARIGSKRSNSLFFVKILWIHRLTDFNHISRNIPLYSSREFYIFTRQIKQRLNVAINHRAIIAGDLSDDRREIAKKRFAVKWNQKSGRSAFHILWLQHPQR